MRILYTALIICLIGSVSGYSQSNKKSNKKSSNSENTSSEPTTAKSNKAKKTYKSNKFHNSTRHYDKVDDVLTDRSLKNASEVKKANSANSDKYKKSQAQHLNNLNSNTRYKDSKRNTGIFYIY